MVNLPNIEDATLQACLAPLASPIAPQKTGASRDPTPSFEPQVVTVGLAPPTNHSPAAFARVPMTLDEWRSLAEQQFAAFGTVEQMASRTDEELLGAVLMFPRQIDSFLARAADIETRLALQHEAITTLMARLRMAMTRAAKRSATGRSGE